MELAIQQNKHSEIKELQLTKEEMLEKVRNAKLSIHPGWLCPLDKELCEKKCYCFVEAYVGSSGVDGEYYGHASCNNKMFTRE